MKTKKLGKTEKELTKNLSEKRESLRKIRFGVGASKNTKETRELKKDIARILTALNNK